MRRSMGVLTGVILSTGACAAIEVKTILTVLECKKLARSEVMGAAEALVQNLFDTLQSCQILSAVAILGVVVILVSHHCGTKTGGTPEGA